ncbi:MAG TPA: cupredoxin domain-containing protein [bacterium]|nr:cupredoxin domain-containing protein [bacterium]
MGKNVSRREALAVAAGGLAGAALMAGPFARMAAAQTQKVTVYIFRGKTGILGPDKKGHDAFVPPNFVIKAGTPVTVDFINYDEGAHTLTSPKAKLDIQIKGGKEVGNDVQPVTTSATFTIAQPGTYRWYCALTCDAGGHGWAMEQGYAGPSKEGYMAGFIVAM